MTITNDAPENDVSVGQVGPWGWRPVPIEAMKYLKPHSPQGVGMRLPGMRRSCLWCVPLDWKRRVEISDQIASEKTSNDFDATSLVRPLPAAV